MNIHQAILMAGGQGTRLWPITGNKHLIPIYDKPMIYYSLGLLMSLGVTKVYLVCDPNSLGKFYNVFGRGESLGISIEYVEQEKPEGIAQGLMLCRNRLEKQKKPFYLMLGDNVFHGHDLKREFLGDIPESYVAPGDSSLLGVIYTQQVSNPEKYGVLFDAGGPNQRIVEKPESVPHGWAVTGLYSYRPEALQHLEGLQKSARGEYEITDFNNRLLSAGKLKVTEINSVAWLDTGTPEGLYEASSYVAAIQQRQGRIICCLEEIAVRQGYLPREEGIELASEIPVNSSYGHYARSVLCRTKDVS